MDLGIRDRQALLCGASRGLGKAGALALAKEGVHVTIVARTRDVLERTAAEIHDATGVRVTPVVADITTVDGRAAALAACPEPDILLNNADGPMPGDFRKWTRDDWIGALDSMMLAPIEMMRATVDGMMARGFGRIVNISSRSVKIPQLELGLSNGARTGLVRIRRGVGASDRRPQRYDQQYPARDLRQRRPEAPHRGNARTIWARHTIRSGASAPPPVRPSAMAIRQSSARISRISARRRRDTSRRKIY